MAYTLKYWRPLESEDDYFQVKSLCFRECCFFVVMFERSDSSNGLYPTLSFELIVALHTDPRSVWCVKSIYLNLFASIGIWQHASCFHLMFFVLNTDKQACFCILLSFAVCLFQQIFYSMDFEMNEEYIIYDSHYCLICIQIEMHCFLIF